MARGEAAAAPSQRSPLRVRRRRLGDVGETTPSGGRARRSAASPPTWGEGEGPAPPPLRQCAAAAGAQRARCAAGRSDGAERRRGPAPKSPRPQIAPPHRKGVPPLLALRSSLEGAAAAAGLRRRAPPRRLLAPQLVLGLHAARAEQCPHRRRLLVARGRRRVHFEGGRSRRGPFQPPYLCYPAAVS